MRLQRILAAVLCFSLLPLAASAQTATTGAIAGVVRDTSGGVLPGVTVEAASPALIERVRTVVTDGQGLYRIVDLRPGVYTVTFTLAGLSTFVREGIELSTAFTATINAELRVGGIQETITVSGSAPVVDVQNVMTRSVFQDKTLDAIPVGRQLGMYASLIPSARIATSGTVTGGMDVGGTQSERSTTTWSVHGGTGDVWIANDGMPFMRGGGSGCTTCGVNRMSAQEVTVQTSGIMAESERGGVFMNVVPKEGGNLFSASGVVEGTVGAMQSDNIGADLRARGVTGSPTVKKLIDAGVGLGGPIVQKKLWFYTAHRTFQTEQWLPGKFYNATQGTHLFTPGEPAASIDHYRSHNLRLTWQASERFKVNVAHEYQDNCHCVIRLIAENRAAEATANHVIPSHFPQVTFSYPRTNRLLFEGGFAYFWSPQYNRLVGTATAEDIGIRDAGTGQFWNARADNTGATGAYGYNYQDQMNQRFAVSYVTGTHNFKVGLFMMQMWSNSLFEVNQAQQHVYRNGVPIQVVQYATPEGRQTRGRNHGLYVQDQWTVMPRLTLNLGVRFDQYRAWTGENSLPAGPFVGARHFAETDDLVNLRDISPRVGFAYDLFGNGKTALKGFLGRYVVGQSGVGSEDPAARIVLSATRAWSDTNGDFIPQANELGPLSNAQFGNPVASNTTVDRDVSFGFGNRAYTWQGSVSIDHQLWPDVGVNVGYFRTSYGNLTYTDNVRVTPADFNPYCVTAPTDSRLPGGGGFPICGLYDINPSRFGQVQEEVRLAGDLSSQVFNGVDVTMNARFGRGGLLSGGLATGQTVWDNCGAAVDSPQGQLFCRQTLRWSDDLAIKLFAAIPLPWDVRASATYQNVPGTQISAARSTPSSEIAPSLGRNLSAGANANVSIPLIEPFTMFEARTAQLSFRFTKSIRVGRVRATPNFDIYNVFNASTPQAINLAYGANWLYVLNALSGRLLKFGVVVDF